MIGSLLYLIATRPDIMFSVGLYVRFQSNPTQSHLKAIKRIFTYLKGAQKLGLWYPKYENFELLSYEDVDFVSYQIDRKSTFEICQLLGYALIS